MNKLRQFHLLSGCFFAPLIIFFACSGAWQVGNLHHSRKDGSYQAPRVLTLLSNVHMNQFAQVAIYKNCTGIADPVKLSECAAAVKKEGTENVWFYRLFRGLLVLLAMGMVGSTVSGVAMAFGLKNVRPKALTLVALGAAFPILLIALAK